MSPVEGDGQRPVAWVLVFAGVGGQRPGRRRARDDPAGGLGLVAPGQSRVEDRLEDAEYVERLSAEQLVQDAAGDDQMHQAGRRVRQHHHADAVVWQQHAMGRESVDAAGVHGELVVPVVTDRPAETVSVLGDSGHQPGVGHQHVRRELAFCRGRRHHGHIVELPAR